MKMPLKLVVVFSLSLAILSARALGQEQASPSNDAARGALFAASQTQPAQPVGIPSSANSLDVFLQSAFMVCESIDKGLGGILWQEATADLRRVAASEDRLISSLSQSRKGIGNLVQREWVQINRFVVNDQSRPEAAGVYLSVQLASRFEKLPLALESVIYRIEGDRWRISGYRIDAPPPGASPATSDGPVRPAP